MPMNVRLLRPSNSFSPRSFSGLRIWYDATVASSMTLNGSTVSQINDLSGNNFHATQGVANNQPTYEASGINSRPSLLHDTTDSLFSTATAANIVANPTTAPVITIVIVASSTSPNAGLAVGCEPAANGRIVGFLPFDNNPTNAYWDVAGTGTGRLSFSISTAQRAAGVYTLQRNGASMLVRRNGVQLASRSDAAQVFTTTSSVFGIGQITFASGFAGQWSQCVVYNTALSLTQMQAVERYIASRSGITL